MASAAGVPPAAMADTYTATPASYRGLLQKLRPGDVLELTPGDYLDGLPVIDMLGEAKRPIVIRGQRSQPRPRFLAREDANTVSIANSAWVEIRNLELDGWGHTSSAVRGEGHAHWAHHITLENLLIKGHGAHQNVTGISVFCPAWGWVIRDNTIVGAGTGIYLGQSDGTAPFVAGLIERNVIADSIGYNMQIKHQHPRPAVEGMPRGRSTTIIRYNVFAKSDNSSQGEMARPNLLVGHWPPVGPGTDDAYAIYGNFFYQNPSEALFQGEGNFAFYSNVLVNTFGDAIHVQPHNAVPRRIDIFHNTVLAAGTGIRVTGGDPQHAQRVVANAVFAGTPLAGGDQHANWTGAYVEAADRLVKPLADQPDLSPRPGALAVEPYAFVPQAPVPDATRDFDGRVFVDPVAGAYAGGRIKRRLSITPAR